MRAAFAGGGTAGHIMPGLAVGKKIAAELPGSEILFFTLKKNTGFAPLALSGFRIEHINTAGLAGKSPCGAAGSLMKSAGGFIKALDVLRRFRPDVVVGLGGYASAPVVLAGLFLRRRVVLLEQNFVPGLATRVFARFADEVELSFEGSRRFISSSASCRVPGNPVREEIISAGRREGMERLGIPPGKKVLAVLGGSSGAGSLNLAMESLLENSAGDAVRERVLGDWHIIHVTGSSDYERLNNVYKRLKPGSGVYSFLDEIWHVYASADLLLARAGGNTVAEAAARGIPAVYVPYPLAAGGHQDHNARAFCSSGGAVMVEDAGLKSERFGEILFSLMSGSGKREEMARAARRARTDSASAVFKRILAVAEGRA